MFMKYMAGLSDYIRKEMNLFTVESIAEASVKAIALEGKQKKGNEAKGDSKQTEGESSGSQSKEEKKKGDPGKTGLICSHCEKTGHEADRCWEKYPHLKPRGLKKKEEKKAYMIAQGPKEVPVMTEPNSSLNLMTGKQATKEDDDPREQLFVLKLQVKTSLVDAIVDPGSEKNLISEALV